MRIIFILAWDGTHDLQAIIIMLEYRRGCVALWFLLEPTFGGKYCLHLQGENNKKLRRR
jgi:hypothetical protein